MTSFGLIRVEPKDAGAASGIVNTFHQVGSALGLSILVAMGSAANAATSGNQNALLQRVNVALVGSAILLSVALVIVLALVARRSRKDAA
jgi:hypothetical protein